MAPNDFAATVSAVLSNEEFAALLLEVQLAPHTAAALNACYATPPGLAPHRANHFRVGLVRLIKVLRHDSAETRLIFAQLQTLATLRFEHKLTYFCEGLTNFNDNQVITLAYCLADLNTLMRSEGLEATLTSALIMGPCALYRGAGFPALQKTAVARMQNLHIFLRYLADLPFYQSTMEPGRQYWIEPSGSDAHLGNRQVVFRLERDNPSHRLAFKPRCMKPDRAVSMCINAYNKIVPPKYELYAPDISLDPSHPIGSMEWINQMPKMTMDQARRYYTKVGALIFLAKLIGLTDLHQDNIFPTCDGPVVVDAECAFTPEVLHSTDLFDTLLSMALLESDGDDGPARACFSVIDDKDANKTNPSTGLLRAGHFTNEILDGFQLAVQRCTQRWKTLATDLVAAYATLEKIRYVPLKTAGFYALASTRMGGLDISATSEFETLVKRLRPLRLVSDAALWQEGLKSALEFSFDNGDIPYFGIHLPYDAQCGELTCNGLCVGSMIHYTSRPIGEVLSHNLAFLASPVALTQLKDFLPPPAPPAPPPQPAPPAPEL